MYLSNMVSSLCKALGSVPHILEQEKESFKSNLATNVLSDI